MKSPNHFKNAARIAALCIAANVFYTAIGNGQENITFIPKTSNAWKYLANGSNQGTAWRAKDFNDGSWPTGTGPIGYGDGGLGTTVASSSPHPYTMYFRHNFQISALQLSTVQLLQLQIRKDDGAVVYLNGVEVYRTGMSNATIFYNTPATNTAGGSGETNYESKAIFGSILVDNLVLGKNVLAVEVHQASTSSSDSHMDASLTGNPPDYGVVGANRSIKFEEAVEAYGEEAREFERLEGFGYLDYEWISEYLGGSTEVGYRGAASYAHNDGTPLLSAEWNILLSEGDVKSENIDLRNYTDVKVSFKARSSVAELTSFSASDYLKMGARTSLDGIDFSTNIFATNVTGAGGGGIVANALVSTTSPKTVKVPTSNVENTASPNWKLKAFNDATWKYGESGGAGFEGGSGYQDFINPALDVYAQMYNKNGSLYMRVPFTSPSLASITSLELRVKYDDAYVAYINGTEVARRRFTGTPTWNSLATEGHGDDAAVVWSTINVTSFKNLLIPGSNNVLAIQGLNTPLNSSDMLLLPELLAYQSAPPVYPPISLNDMVTPLGGSHFSWEINIPDTAESMYVYAEAKSTSLDKWIFVDNISVTGKPIIADNYPNWILLKSDYDIDEPEGMASGDGDGDSIANLIEYATGGDPIVANLKSPGGFDLLPKVEIVDGGGGSTFMQMTYRQILDNYSGTIEDGGYFVRDIQYIPQISVNGFTWRQGAPNSPPVATLISFVENEAEGFADVTVRFTGFPLVDEDEAYGRLKVMEVAP